MQFTSYIEFFLMRIYIHVYAFPPMHFVICSGVVVIFLDENNFYSDAIL